LPAFPRLLDTNTPQSSPTGSAFSLGTQPGIPPPPPFPPVLEVVMEPEDELAPPLPHCVQSGTVKQPRAWAPNPMMNNPVVPIDQLPKRVATALCLMFIVLT
jgi:hypothetical protein